MNTPTPEQVRESLRWFDEDCIEGILASSVPVVDQIAAREHWRVLESALAPPPAHYPWQNKPCDDCGGTLDCVYVSDEDWKALQAGRPEGVENRGHYICSRCMDSAARRVGRRVVGEVHYGWQNKGEPGLVVSPTPPPVEDAEVEEALREAGGAHLVVCRFIDDLRQQRRTSEDVCDCGMAEREATLRADRDAKDAEIERFCDADTAMQEDLARVEHQRDCLQLLLDAAEHERDALNAEVEWLRKASCSACKGTGSVVLQADPLGAEEGWCECALGEAMAEAAALKAQLAAKLEAEARR